MFASAAAPISAETQKYFGSLVIPIIEGYGMSECTGISSLCLPGLYKVAHVGVPAPGCEFKLDHVDGRDPEGEGELCWRSRANMM